LTALLEGRAPQAPRALKPETSSGLLQASSPYPRGGPWWYRVFLMPYPVTAHLSDPGWEPESPWGLGQGARRRRFLALMVGALGSTAPTPPRGHVVDIS
jgi:hypothetical protein